MIACDVCGTDNESKLTFCRTCGHRLAQKRSRGGASTPPVVARNPELPSTTAPADDGWTDDDAGWELDLGPRASQQRPSAPVLDLLASEPSDDPDRGAGGANKIKCGKCMSFSPQGYRFCINCGATLSPSAAPQVTNTKPGGQRQHRNRGDRGPGVVSKAEPRGANRLGAVACGGCGGKCDRGESFCKFCGASLGSAPPRPERAGKAVRSDGKARKPLQKKQQRSDARLEPFPLADTAEVSNAVRLAERPPKKSSAPPRQERERGGSGAKVTGRLVVIVEDGSEGSTLELRGSQVDIGGTEGDITLTEDRYLSPRHARFFRQDGNWYLRDLASVNGVYRRLRRPMQLQHGDMVLLGLEVLEFQLVDHAERGLGHAIQHGVLVFGSPAATRRARLCQWSVEGVVRDVYHLVADETTVGRETGDIVFTSDPFMSRRHAAIQWDDEAQEYVLVDLNSSNGTYLAIRDDVCLENGDFIRLGQHLFRVDLPQTRKR